MGDRDRAVEKLEQITAFIDELLIPDYDTEQDYWEWGNHTDTYEYGMECGEQILLRELKKTLTKF